VALVDAARDAEVLPRRVARQLPETDGARARRGVRMIRRFDERQRGERERQAFSDESRLHRRPVEPLRVERRRERLPHAALHADGRDAGGLGHAAHEVDERRRTEARERDPLLHLVHARRDVVRSSADDRVDAPRLGAIVDDRLVAAVPREHVDPEADRRRERRCHAEIVHGARGPRRHAPHREHEPGGPARLPSSSSTPPPPRAAVGRWGHRHLQGSCV
jgi:hypothetical protein